MGKKKRSKPVYGAGDTEFHLECHGIPTYHYPAGAILRSRTGKIKKVRGGWRPI